MAGLTFHKVVSSLPSSLAGDAVYANRVGTGYDLVVTNSAGTPFELNKPLVFSEQGIVVHSQIGSNTFTNAVTKSVDLYAPGDWLLTLSFNFNCDSTTTDIAVRATWDGGAIDLNDRDADPDGQYQILRYEVRDSANSPAGAITGTGSGQKLSYAMQFVLSNQTAGLKDIVIDVGSEGSQVRSATWNVIGKFERITLI